jgi:hypothetical protein
MFIVNRIIVIIPTLKGSHDYSRVVNYTMVTYDSFGVDGVVR